ncbi:acetyl-CoA hydrolase/transferase C-terminal domain-containing protein [Bdellovibrio bacteriovorus]|uniref:acetyl-CoA hydrolase/transferase C-terminal domain-containing protein n=1 Tax=Bdellovibrio bacteriovorus TaxID=959 RepID=UPI0035A648BF
MDQKPRQFHSFETAVDALLNTLGPVLRVAAPLGLGKPNQLINLLYNRVKDLPDRRLEIYTALSLDIPSPQSDLERRFLSPFLDRHFGPDYPVFEYLKDRRHGELPGNVRIHEFYFQAGQALHAESAQQNYVSLNYTHVASYLVECNIEVVLQLVACRQTDQGPRYSLSCNPDLTLDVIDQYRKAGKKILLLGVIHPELPFLGTDAEVSPDYFDMIVEDPHQHRKLFALPRTPVDWTDHLIGFLASHLLEDDGTLQIGIGSLSEALVYSACLRHQKGPDYEVLSEKFWQHRRHAPELRLYRTPFEKGLYGTSEMVMDGFMNLRKAGILKRQVQEPVSKQKRYLHGAFFLGSSELYKWLRHLEGEEFDGLNMTRVSIVNDLYDGNELALRRQRRKARFFNTCMNVTLLGSAASDTLESGTVVSGVGGQYNFVAMAHELEEAHSVLMLRSTRQHKGRRHSNILWSHGQLTIPRHLRDIVITEYGIAYLRGKTDEEVIKELLNIADSEFQESLKIKAQKEGKLRSDYQIPEWARHNTPAELLMQAREAGFDRLFPPFAFGSDFTLDEELLALALGELRQAQEQSLGKLLGLLRKGLKTDAREYQDCLKRMELNRPRGLREWLFQKLVLGALEQSKGRITSAFSAAPR